MKTVRENGIDGVGGLVAFTSLAVVCFIVWLATGLTTSWLIATLFYVAMASCFLYTTLIGKQKIWDQQLPQLTLSTDTRALDIGCGHGMVLFKIAYRLPAGGHITGIDIWRQQDQTNNSLATVTQRIHAEGLDQVAAVQTADMRELPLQITNLMRLFLVWRSITSNLRPDGCRACGKSRGSYNQVVSW